MYVLTCIYIHVYTYIYVHKYIHIYIHYLYILIKNLEQNSD